MDIFEHIPLSLAGGSEHTTVEEDACDREGTRIGNVPREKADTAESRLHNNTILVIQAMAAASSAEARIEE